MSIRILISCILLLLPMALAAAQPAGAAPSSRIMVAQNERFTGTVEIYVTSWCGYCSKALSYMKSRGISHVAYDIEKDDDAMKRYRELGGRGVPLIIIGQNRMSGFSAESLEYYLNNTK
jgi:glutaredoxin